MRMSASNKRGKRVEINMEQNPSRVTRQSKANFVQKPIFGLCESPPCGLMRLTFSSQEFRSHFKPQDKISITTALKKNQRSSNFRHLSPLCHQSSSSPFFMRNGTTRSIYSHSLNPPLPGPPHQSQSAQLDRLTRFNLSPISSAPSSLSLYNRTEFQKSLQFNLPTHQALNSFSQSKYSLGPHSTILNPQYSKTESTFSPFKKCSGDGKNQISLIGSEKIPMVERYQSFLPFKHFPNKLESPKEEDRKYRFHLRQSEEFQPLISSKQLNSGDGQQSHLNRKLPKVGLARNQSEEQNLHGKSNDQTKRMHLCFEKGDKLIRKIAPEIPSRRSELVQIGVPLFKTRFSEPPKLGFGMKVSESEFNSDEESKNYEQYSEAEIIDGTFAEFKMNNQRRKKISSEFHN